MDNILNHAIRVLFYLMLPIPDNIPATRRKLCVDFTVTPDVAAYFSLPEPCIGGGALIMEGTTVPETTINKYCNFRPGKDNIRFSR